MKLKQKLFRAWCPTSKQFIQKDFSIIGETTIFGMLEIHKHELKEKHNLDAVLELEITEFTGAHDCKGVKIYEGDILTLGNESIYLVSWNDTDCCWAGLYKDTSYISLIWVVFEVIGNVFENPELLK